MAGYTPSYHNRRDALLAASADGNGAAAWHWEEKEANTWQQWTLTASFQPHFHPFVQELMERLVTRSIPGLQGADTEWLRQADNSIVTLPDGKPRPVLYRELFDEGYQPTALVATPHPVAEIDFGPVGATSASDGAYAVYNWELFFHVPVAIAIQLSRNGRYDEAQRWFHYVFDPTDDSDGPTPERFWKTKPFRTTDVQSIEDILTNLSGKADQHLLESTVDALHEWQEDPFRPHLVARHRPSAYMIWTVMAYLDNLIAWGDALFRQDTGEAIGEATQLYVLAANLLGPRPQQVPAKGTVLPQTYQSLRGRLDDLSNALVQLENTIPFDTIPAPGPSADGAAPRRLAGIGRSLYFCVPRNDKLMDYWDTVADRLFKIRNSLSLQGVFRQLPTFDARIDPALLARAAAAGLDIAAVVAGVNEPPPLVRFGVLVAKAGELCQEVKSLGAALLSAIEKQDAEALTVLRTRHETTVLRMAETIKFGQHQESIKNREALEASLTLAQARYSHYERLLGRPESDLTFEALTPLDEAGLDRGQFTATEPAVGSRPVDIDIDPSAVPSGGGPAGGKKISSHEAQELGLLGTSQILQDVASGLEAVGALLNIIPLFSGDVKPFGVGAGVQFGGYNISRMLSGLASVPRGVAGRLSHEAGTAARVGTYARREQDWQFQSNAAAGDITQLNKQLRAAQLREFLAERDLENHRKQIKQAAEVEAFLSGERPTGKTTTTGYYAVLRREVRGLYNACYDLAMECARKAERAMRNELGDQQVSFVQPSYLAGPEGLLAGERLHLDVRRMELAYLDLNQREYELTQRVSLLQVAPWALIQLRATGRCQFTVPEEFFDLSTPGHFFRRLRSVAVTIPCTTGDVTGVACTARLLRSRVRTNPLIGDSGYPANPDGDERFTELLGTTDVIVTSTAINDTGTFSGGAEGERLAPFELKGAAGEWSLELPTDPAPFDLATMTDVVLIFRYTARDGGQPLRRAASANLRSLIAAAGAAGSARLLSVRHEFPTAWARLTAGTAGDGTAGHPRSELTVALRREHYPFFAGAGPDALVSLDLVARPRDPATRSLEVADRAVDTGNPAEPTRRLTLSRRTELGDHLLRGTLPRRPINGAPGWEELPPPVGSVSLYLDHNDLDDLYLLLRWQG
jgi:receptor-binding and translocation channel-forming TcA subunit of Tc toxin